MRDGWAWLASFCSEESYIKHGEDASSLFRLDLEEAAMELRFVLLLWGHKMSSVIMKTPTYVEKYSMENSGFS
ncbi:Hypothetical predicted protein [Podarcis lilfordi]|uniref:Uncharacterized protein n=1 Tax=Podarcis lilfordi TaxID=74358 RepID=A0AA35K108_9SAUR|nr:Hypothetical predicted protein [Podarcis lilfordi]